MSLIDEINADIKKIRSFWLPWPVIFLLFVLFSAFFYALDHFSITDRAVPAIMTITVFSLVIFSKQNIWGSLWFWAVFLVMGIGHFLILLCFPWPMGWVPAFVSALLSLVDLYLLLFIINFLVRNNSH
ncbi:MAG: hypothetical protein WC692_08430 [Erythrobacter sp.]|jgi:hypothetical protein